MIEPTLSSELFSQTQVDRPATRTALATKTTQGTPTSRRPKSTSSKSHVNSNII